MEKHVGLELTHENTFLNGYSKLHFTKYFLMPLDPEKRG